MVGEQWQFCKLLPARHGISLYLTVMLKIARSVLIVDDDVEVLHVTRDALGSFLGWDVTTSPNPEYGFELAMRMEFDLFIFDLSMPRLTGDVLYSMIGTAYAYGFQGTRSTPPLLLVTAHARDERSRELLRTSGVRGILGKPYTIQNLLDKAEACLETAAPTRKK